MRRKLCSVCYAPRVGLEAQDDNSGFNPEIQLIVPRKRIQFIKIENGEKIETKSCCNFDCYYYCRRMNLPKTIIHLPEVKSEKQSESKPVKVKAEATVCKGFNKKGKPCQNKVKCGEFCHLHKA